MSNQPNKKAEKMSDAEINCAIAEACGWVLEPTEDGNSPYWMSPKGVFPFEQPPNYVEDLNAIREAELTIRNNHDTWIVYVNTLSRTVGQWHVVHATARQRAEAFLKTIGKWKD